MCQIFAVEQRGYGIPRNPHSLKIVTISRCCVSVLYNAFELSRGVARTRHMRPLWTDASGNRGVFCEKFESGLKFIVFCNAIVNFYE